ncbi:MAG: hypothetical protein WAW96_12970 [Alphaproteobacteria bacterium]
MISPRNKVKVTNTTAHDGQPLGWALTVGRTISAKAGVVMRYKQMAALWM